MGEVFLADQVGPMGPVRPVALKRMLPRIAHDAKASKMFLEEMAIAAQFNHPNIATTYDFGEIDGMYFMAMEYVEGLSLRQLVAALGPLPVPEATAIAIDVANALAYAHAKKRPDGSAAPVVHRDVSPHNVMISTEGAVKLLDFGIAKAEAVVMGGRLEGKIAYAAPEQLQGDTVDRRSDIWALGVVLYEISCGIRPFEHDDPVAMVAAALRAGYEPLSRLRPQARPLDSVIAQALRADREERWETAAELAAACREAQTSLGPADPSALAALVVQAGGPAKSTLGVENITSMGKKPVAPPPTATIQVEEVAEAIKTEVPLDDPTVEELARDDVLDVIVDEAMPGHRTRRNVGIALLVCLLLGAGLTLLLWTPPEPEVVSWPAERRGGPVAIPPPTEPKAPSEAPSTAPPAPKPAVAAPPALEPPPPAGAKPLRKKPRKRRGRKRSRPKPAKTAKAPAKAPASSTGLGMLSLRTVPWGPAEIDGRRVGPPLNKQPLAPGKHHLKLFPPDGLGKPPVELDVTVKSGKVTKVFVDFNRDLTKVDEGL